MNKPVKPESLRVLPPGLASRLQSHVDAGVFDSVSEAVFVASSALADQLEFKTRDDTEAIRRSIEAAQAEGDYVDTDVFFAELKAKLRAGDD